MASDESIVFNIGLVHCSQGMKVCLKGSHIMVPSLMHCSALAVMVSLDGNQVIVEICHEDGQLLFMEHLGFVVGEGDGLAFSLVVEVISMVVNPINNAWIYKERGWC